MIRKPSTTVKQANRPTSQPLDVTQLDSSCVLACGVRVRVRVRVRVVALSLRSAGWQRGCCEHDHWRLGIHVFE